VFAALMSVTWKNQYPSLPRARLTSDEAKSVAW